MFPKLGMLYVACYKVPLSLLCLPFSFESSLSLARTFLCYGMLWDCDYIHGYTSIHIRVSMGTPKSGLLQLIYSIQQLRSRFELEKCIPVPKKGYTKKCWKFALKPQSPRTPYIPRPPRAKSPRKVQKIIALGTIITIVLCTLNIPPFGRLLCNIRSARLR
jgi:hypothetical protein